MDAAKNVASNGPRREGKSGLSGGVPMIMKFRLLSKKEEDVYLLK